MYALKQCDYDLSGNYFGGVEGILIADIISNSNITRFAFKYNKLRECRQAVDNILAESDSVQSFETYDRDPVVYRSGSAFVEGGIKINHVVNLQSNPLLSTGIKNPWPEPAINSAYIIELLSSLGYDPNSSSKSPEPRSQDIPAQEAEVTEVVGEESAISEMGGDIA